MGLETRGNSIYYYRKRRIGNRVVSEYCGSGTLAECFQILEEERRYEARLDAEEKERSFDAECRTQDELDEVIDAFSDEAQALEEALYLISGYHVHQRQWRRKRNDNKDEEC